ncbi:hypothetical protein TRICI_005641 [Trichomonascus ciferrii]|uniref:Uncharacterized protein n=1 Tax=Trichomonascus ciferrii TaxID=44093 RepID=A0A642UR36_9ASCO|nr:hypothetical protein TRICI_005641 [Trichomonascus ciferrii]
MDSPQSEREQKAIQNEMNFLREHGVWEGSGGVPPENNTTGSGLQGPAPASPWHCEASRNRKKRPLPIISSGESMGRVPRNNHWVKWIGLPPRVEAYSIMLVQGWSWDLKSTVQEMESNPDEMVESLWQWDYLFMTCCINEPLKEFYLTEAKSSPCTTRTGMHIED